MTQEDKKLVLQDLCGRLPYGVKIKIRSNDIRTVRTINIEEELVTFFETDTISPFGLHIENPLTFRQQVKPYLRPMSSMTEEEEKEFHKQIYKGKPYSDGKSYNIYEVIGLDIDWLNAHHFDYRGLIPMGLALEAPEGMYNIE